MSSPDAAAALQTLHTLEREFAGARDGSGAVPYGSFAAAVLRAGGTLAQAQEMARRFHTHSRDGSAPGSLYATMIASPSNSSSNSSNSSLFGTQVDVGALLDDMRGALGLHEDQPPARQITPVPATEGGRRLFVYGGQTSSSTTHHTAPRHNIHEKNNGNRPDPDGVAAAAAVGGSFRFLFSKQPQTQPSRQPSLHSASPSLRLVQTATRRAKSVGSASAGASRSPDNDHDNDEDDDDYCSSVSRPRVGSRSMQRGASFGREDVGAFVRADPVTMRAASSPSVVAVSVSPSCSGGGKSPRALLEAVFRHVRGQQQQQQQQQRQHHQQQRHHAQTSETTPRSSLKRSSARVHNGARANQPEPLASLREIFDAARSQPSSLTGRTPTDVISLAAFVERLNTSLATSCDLTGGSGGGEFSFYEFEAVANSLGLEPVTASAAAAESGGGLADYWLSFADFCLVVSRLPARQIERLRRRRLWEADCATERTQPEAASTCESWTVSSETPSPNPTQRRRQQQRHAGEGTGAAANNTSSPSPPLSPSPSSSSAASAWMVEIGRSEKETQVAALERDFRRKYRALLAAAKRSAEADRVKKNTTERRCKGVAGREGNVSDDADDACEAVSSRRESVVRSLAAALAQLRLGQKQGPDTETLESTRRPEPARTVSTLSLAAPQPRMIVPRPTTAHSTEQKEATLENGAEWKSSKETANQEGSGAPSHQEHQQKSSARHRLYQPTAATLSRQKGIPKVKYVPRTTVSKSPPQPLRSPPRHQQQQQQHKRETPTRAASAGAAQRHNNFRGNTDSVASNTDSAKSAAAAAAVPTMRRRAASADSQRVYRSTSPLGSYRNESLDASHASAPTAAAVVSNTAHSASTAAAAPHIAPAASSPTKYAKGTSRATPQPPTVPVLRVSLVAFTPEKKRETVQPAVTSAPAPAAAAGAATMRKPASSNNIPVPSPVKVASSPSPTAPREEAVTAPAEAAPVRVTPSKSMDAFQNYFLSRQRRSSPTPLPGAPQALSSSPSRPTTTTTTHPQQPKEQHRRQIVNSLWSDAAAAGDDHEKQHSISSTAAVTPERGARTASSRTDDNSSSSFHSPNTSGVRTGERRFSPSPSRNDDSRVSHASTPSGKATTVPQLSPALVQKLNRRTSLWLSYCARYDTHRTGRIPLKHLTLALRQTLLCGLSHYSGRKKDTKRAAEVTGGEPAGDSERPFPSLVLSDAEEREVAAFAMRVDGRQRRRRRQQQQRDQPSDSPQQQQHAEAEQWQEVECDYVLVISTLVVLEGVSLPSSGATSLHSSPPTADKRRGGDVGGGSATPPMSGSERHEDSRLSEVAEQQQRSFAHSDKDGTVPAAPLDESSAEGEQAMEEEEQQQQQEQLLHDMFMHLCGGDRAVLQRYFFTLHDEARCGYMLRPEWRRALTQLLGEVGRDDSSQASVDAAEEERQPHNALTPRRQALVEAAVRLSRAPFEEDDVEDSREQQQQDRLSKHGNKLLKQARKRAAAAPADVRDTLCDYRYVLERIGVL